MSDDERGRLGPLEFADGPRDDTFLASWGWAPGRKHSAERRQWIIDNIRRESGPTGPHAQLAAADARLIAIIRAAELNRRR